MRIKNNKPTISPTEESKLEASKFASSSWMDPDNKIPRRSTRLKEVKAQQIAYQNGKKKTITNSPSMHSDLKQSNEKKQDPSETNTQTPRANAKTNANATTTSIRSAAKGSANAMANALQIHTTAHPANKQEEFEQKDEHLTPSGTKTKKEHRITPPATHMRKKQTPLTTPNAAQLHHW